LVTSVFNGCAVLNQNKDLSLTRDTEPANILDLQSVALAEVSPAKRKPIIAVYANSFQDLTGQRKSNSSFALFSTAVTQAPEALLIRALKHAANGEFFRVVERVGLDNLTKERQLIRSTRENFEQDQKLQPLLFAGLIIQGGVISYDTNVESGGIGARYLGIGTSKQYREDVVTISLRLVSVSTGEILVETTVSKNVLSTSVSQDVFKFYEQGTELVEIEGGVAENEVGSIALQKAIEAGVFNLIEIGIERGYWEYETIKIDEPSCDVDCVDNIRG
jgi:curli production assembly/transport component CsgG